jgi:hypothetical protein
MTCRATIGALRCVRADGHDSTELTDGKVTRKAVPHMCRNGWTWDESPYLQTGMSPFFEYLADPVAHAEWVNSHPYGEGENVAFAKACALLGIPVTWSMDLISIDGVGGGQP